MFSMTASAGELIVRAVCIYVVLLFLMRLSGKRTVGQFTPFDLLVMLLFFGVLGGTAYLYLKLPTGFLPLPLALSQQALAASGDEAALRLMAATLQQVLGEVPALAERADSVEITVSR